MLSLSLLPSSSLPHPSPHPFPVTLLKIWTSAVTRGLMQGLERDISLAVENSHLAADAFRVLSYALAHPDSLVAVLHTISFLISTTRFLTSVALPYLLLTHHTIQATVARELKLGSVGLMEAVKTASLSCHELAFWAQAAWTSLQRIPKDALDAVEASVPEEVSP